MNFKQLKKIYLSLKYNSNQLTKDQQELLKELSLIFEQDGGVVLEHSLAIASTNCPACGKPY